MKSSPFFKLLSAGALLAATHLASPAAHAAPPPPDTDFGVCTAPPTLPAARAAAHQLVSQIRADLAAVEDQIRDVPFVTAVEDGTASPELITAVIAEEYSIIRSDWASLAQMTARFDDKASRDFFNYLAGGEAYSLDLLLNFAENVGLDEHDLVEYEPRPGSQTYPARVAWMAQNADRASAAASFLVNFAVFGENMGRIRDALMTVYGMSGQEVEFFSFFAEEIPGFEDSAVEVIAAGLRRGACARDVRRSARLLQAYELDFWQSASAPPGSPLPVIWPAGP
ncbi:MAG: hypothetical protein R3B70_09695 [Polyangiaceae bacterium]